MKEKILSFDDFDNLAKKGVIKIVMSEQKLKELQNTMEAKEMLKEETLASVDYIHQIHTDFGPIVIETVDSEHHLREGQEVKFVSLYKEKDLVQYRHGGSKEAPEHRQKKHYSKIMKIIPAIDKSSFVLRFNYVMENGRTVPFEDILSLEKKG